MLNCSPQSSLPVPWPFWELRGCTAGDITLFKERAGVARSAQIIPAVKQNLIKIESFFFSLRLCHGVFLQSENYKLRTKRTHCCGKQGIRLYKCYFALQNACWAVPNPLHSAPFRCRLRVFSKRFYLYKVEFQDSCALQFWWRHLKPNEQPATASTVSEVIMLAVLRSDRNGKHSTFSLVHGTLHPIHANPLEVIVLLSLYLAVLDDQSKEEQFIDVYKR